MMNTIKKIAGIWCFIMIAQISSAYINPDLQPMQSDPSNTTSLREDCLEAIETTFLNINNVRAMLQVGGDVWWNLDRGQYIVPVPEPGDDEVSAIFSGSVWVGGLDPVGNIKLAAGPNGAYYQRDGSVDWYSGPLDSMGVTDKPICDDWNTFFEVDGENVRNFVTSYDADPENFDCDSIPDDVKSWPGKNNPFWGEFYDFELPANQNLGAFWDEDLDGDYNPCNGDFPIINIRDCEPINRAAAFELLPDQMIFWVYNDNGGAHRISFATPIRMEVQVQSFAYSTNDAINDMTFNRYKLINKASEDIRSTYFAMWVDPDLGCYQDDYIGCDVGRSLAYVYNEDAIDGINGSGTNCGDVPTYGEQVPLLGVDYFRGPRGPKLFSRDDNGNIQLNEDGDTILLDPPLGSGDIDTLVELGMSAFTYMNNGGFNPPPATTDATQASEFYGIMRGFWHDDTPVTFGGDGYNPGSTDTVKYVFPSEPNDESAGAWSMCSADLPFGDRRTLQVTGPLLLQPLAQNELIIGVVFVPDEQSYPCPDISRLLTADDLAQSLFDNCFNITDGPDAPDLCTIELDREVIITLSNAPGSNNADEDYEEEDLQISDVTVTGDDRLYKFEGYQIYQLINGSVTPQELDNIEKARVVFQTDVKNGTATLYNWTSMTDPTDMSSIIYAPVRQVIGTDTGIKRTLSLTEDQFSLKDDKRLLNHTTYYYMAVAYGFNEYEEFKPNTGVGQPRPYIEGRRNVQTYAVTPRPIVYEELQAAYGDVPAITRTSGVGSGLTFIDLADDMYDKILSGTTEGRVTYKQNAGPINVKIYNPLDVKEGNFKLEVYGESLDDKGQYNFLGDSARWRLTNLDDNVVIESDTTLNIANEQLINDYGFSIELNQIEEPGDDAEVNNGAVGSRITYDDVNSPNWFTGVPDGGLGNGDRLLDWVINNNSSDEDGDLAELSTIFYPYLFNRYATPGETDPAIYISPAWRQTGGQGFLVSQDRLQLGDLNNVDVIFTSDKSKWSRCIVVETASDMYGSAGLETEGNAKMMDLREHASVDKDGNPDGDGNGMGWFPGYAVDVETGERLNIFFGENSVYNEAAAEFLTEAATGGDMIFNPTSETVGAGAPDTQPGFGIFNLVGGGQHFIYLTRTKYDECAQLRADIDGANVPNKFNPLSFITWTAFPVLSPDTELLPVSEGLIPNDLKIQLRVTNPYGFESQTDYNNPNDPERVEGLPTFEFALEGVSSRELGSEEYEGALENVNVVPNPYYAYSAYERSEFDNQVKVTNLPERADVTIYSIDGKFIRQFRRDEPRTFKAAGKPVQSVQPFPDLSWDLKNDRGVPVASGVYLIHVRAEITDSAGNVTEEERVIKWFGIGRKFDPSGL